MRKPTICICENKDTDQLRGNREADQRLCFRYITSTIPLLPKYEISSLWPPSDVVQPGLCGTWSETPKTGFLTTRLICDNSGMISNISPLKLHHKPIQMSEYPQHTLKEYYPFFYYNTPFTQLLQTRVCFNNAGINNNKI